MFDKAVNVTSFYKTFAYCDNLEEVPGNLFDNAVKATDFYKTFSQCSKLVSGPQIWERANENQIPENQQTYYECEKFNTTGLSSTIIRKYFGE